MQRALRCLLGPSLFAYSLLGVGLGAPAPAAAQVQPPAGAPVPYQPEQPPPVPQQPDPAQIPPMPAPNGPVVQMRTTDLAATLFQLQGESYSFVVRRRYVGYQRFQNWAPVCRAPCGMVVDPSGIYSIRGRNLVPSGEFMLPTQGIAQLDVNAGHRGPRAGGVILTTFGGMATAIGIVFTAVGSGRQSPGMLTGGIATLAIGGGMLAGGIALIVATKTRVYTHGGLRIAARLAPMSGIGVAAGP
jgi:hypothetical protein